MYFHDSKSDFSFTIVQMATDDQHTNTQITKNEFHSTHPTIYVIKYLSWGFDSIVSSYNGNGWETEHYTFSKERNRKFFLFLKLSRLALMAIKPGFLSL